MIKIKKNKKIDTNLKKDKIFIILSKNFFLIKNRKNRLTSF